MSLHSLDLVVPSRALDRPSRLGGTVLLRCGRASQYQDQEPTVAIFIVPKAAEIAEKARLASVLKMTLGRTTRDVVTGLKGLRPRPFPRWASRSAVVPILALRSRVSRARAMSLEHRPVPRCDRQALLHRELQRRCPARRRRGVRGRARLVRPESLPSEGRAGCRQLR
jgi:hypothetical protein